MHMQNLIYVGLFGLKSKGAVKCAYIRQPKMKRKNGVGYFFAPRTKSHVTCS